MYTLQECQRLIRQDIIRMTSAAKSGHPGGSLSAVEILALLYFEIMHIDPTRPKMEDRDKFVLSKGHAAPVLYATLARRGYFDPAELTTLRRLGSRLQGHPDMHSLPGIEIGTGSLGQGISAAVGMALAQKLDSSQRYTYVLTGDGELNEGIVWEAVMAAVHNKLNNLIIFIDENGLQIDGATCDVMNLGDLVKKFEAFGCNTILIEDGHDYERLRSAIASAKTVKDKPSALVCKTVKGKGVSFMENNPAWHGKAPNVEETKQALGELEAYQNG